MYRSSWWRYLERSFGLITSGLLLCSLMPVTYASCPASLISRPSAKAQSLAIQRLGAFMACNPRDPLNDQSPCNTFVARGLASIYGVHDFETATGYMSANAIASYVSHHSQWVKLDGTVFDQDSNLCAQSLANSAVPVIAVLVAPGHGHVALIMPGEPEASPLWGKLVANSASFRYEHPGDAYIGGIISKAFSEEHARRAYFYYRAGSIPGVN